MAKRASPPHTKKYLLELERNDALEGCGSSEVEIALDSNDENVVAPHSLGHHVLCICVPNCVRVCANVSVRRGGGCVWGGVGGVCVCEARKI